MFGSLFESGREGQGGVGRRRQRQDVGQHRFAPRQRTGLVDRQYADLLGAFECLAVLDQDAGGGTSSGRHHDRGRCGQAERAGAGDHQHGDGIDQRRAENPTEGPPGDERAQGNDADDGHEDRRDAIGESLHRCFRALCLGDQTDDASEQGVLADTGRSAAQHSLAVGRGGKDAVARVLGQRHALAGQHGFIHGRRSIEHLAIDRQAFAGADDEDVARYQQRRVEFDQAAVALDARCSGLQAKQCLDGLGGSCLGARLEQLAEQNERDDRGRCFEIDVQVCGAGDRDDGAEHVGHGSAERDEHVHVCPASAQGLPGAIVEAPTDPELDGRCQQELQPARQQVRLVVCADIEHVQHLRGEWQGERGGDPEAAHVCLPGRQSAGPLLCPRILIGESPDEAGPLDGSDQQRRVDDAREVADGCPFGGQIDDRFDVGQAIQELLDPRRAGGTAHAFDRQFDRAQGLGHG